MKILFRLSIFQIMLIIISCSAKPSFVKISNPDQIGIAIKVNPISFTKYWDWENVKTVEDWLFFGASTWPFPSDIITEDDAKAIEKTIIATNNKNKLSEHESKEKYVLNAAIINYTRLEGDSRRKLHQYLMTISYQLIDSDEKNAINKSFSLLQRRYFKTFGGLKEEISEAIAYKIAHDIINQFSASKTKEVKRYKEIQYFLDPRMAIKHFKNI